MRQKRLSLFCSALIVAACAQQLPENTQPEQTGGQVVISVCGDDFVPIVKGKVDAEFIPEIDDLKIEIFKNPGENQVRLYRDTYANTLQKKAINLNCADYRILASYGDSLGVGFDPQKIYYSGTYDFTLEPFELEEAEVLVSVSNVRASVVFGENVNHDFSGFYAKVRSETKGGKVKSLRFDYDETRAGFIPAGKVRVELYVKIDGKELYCPGPDLELEGGNDITFNVETVRQESEIAFEITVKQPEQTDLTYTIPAVLLPKDGPQIDLSGFAETSYAFEPGDQPVDGLRMDMKADGMIAHCWLDIDSDYLSNLGVPARVDLADENLGIEDAAEAEEIKAILQNVGLRWMSHMEGSRLAYVDFTGVTKFITSTPCTPLFDAAFAVELVDARQQNEGSQHIGNVKTDTYTFAQIIPAPVIKVNGFSGSSVSILEGNGVTYDSLTADLTAKGGIKHCWLNIDSPYLKAAGLNDARIDLANIDENSEAAAALRSFGLAWTPSMAGERTGVVDFSGMTEYMDSHMCDGKNAKFAGFSIELESANYATENDKVVEADIADFEYIIPAVTVKNDVVSGNVWAKKILDFSADCSIDPSYGIKPQADKFKLQYRSGDNWVDVPSTKYQYPTLSCERFNSASGTEYQFRAIYNNNPNLVADFTKQTTEAELQIEGADFNSWKVETFTYYAVKIKVLGAHFGGDTYLDRDYYQPLPADLWAINSKKTMPSETTPNFTINALGFNYETGQTQTYKVFPTITKCIVDQSALNYGAQVATIHVCNMATEGNAGDGGLGTLGGWISGVTRTEYLSAGEFCIGTADASGNLTYGTRQFASRPSKVKIRYQYDSYNSETGYIKFELRSGSEVIATHEVKPSSASEWTDYTFDVPYKSLQKKVTSVFVTFKSTSASSPSYKDNGARTLNVNGTDYNVHSGSVLRIDDLTLIYE